MIFQDDHQCLANIIIRIEHDVTALLAVFGSSLTDTLVVTTRSTATIVAQICRKAQISSLTIIILEEIESPRDPPTSQNYRRHHMNNVSCSSKLEKRNMSHEGKVLVPMIQCVRLKYPTILSFINKKLRSWSFYDGVGYEVSNFIVANLDGLFAHFTFYGWLGKILQASYIALTLF